MLAEKGFTLLVGFTISCFLGCWKHWGHHSTSDFHDMSPLHETL